MSPKLNESDLIYAIVNGENIKGQDVLNLIGTDLDQLENNIYELKKNAVISVIKKKYNIASNADLIKNEEWIKNEVSPEDLDKFLIERGMNKKSMSKIDLDNVINNMKFQRSVAEKKKFDDSIFEKLKITWKIPLPPLTLVDINSGMLELWGTKKAQIELIYIGNYHCPTCLQSEKKLNQLKEKYKDNLKILYRFMFDEPIDSIVRLSAEASICAQDQEKFWDFHDAALVKIPQTKKALIEIAMSLKFDEKAFEECLDSRQHKSVIESEINYFKKKNLTETPYYIINGHLLAANAPIEHVIRLIDSLL